jgi:hypothetical protein
METMKTFISNQAGGFFIDVNMNIEQKAKKVKSNLRSMNKVAFEVKRVVC